MDQDALVVAESFLVAHKQELKLDLTWLVLLGRWLLFDSVGPIDSRSLPLAES